MLGQLKELKTYDDFLMTGTIFISDDLVVNTYNPSSNLRMAIRCDTVAGRMELIGRSLGQLLSDNNQDDHM